MHRHTDTHTHTHTHTHTDTQTKYCNPRCACAPRVKDCCFNYELQVVEYELVGLLRFAVQQLKLLQGLGTVHMLTLHMTIKVVHLESRIRLILLRNNWWGRVTIMVWLKFIGLFTLSHGSNLNQQGGHVPLMWPAALCSGLVALSCGWAEIWRNPPTLKKKKSTKKIL